MAANSRRNTVGCGENFPGADYTADEEEFIFALDTFRRQTGRRYPTCTEILKVLKSLGYAKQPPPAGA